MRLMKQTLLLLVAACGGSGGQPVTGAPTATASAVAVAPSASASAAPEDTSPQSIGSRHKKVGNGWFLSGNGKGFYDAIYEPGADPLVVVKPQGDAHGRWVTLMKNVSAAPYGGKKIRVRIAVKSAGVTHGEVWARAAAPHSPEDAPSTTTKLDPTSEMKTYEMTIDVIDSARVVDYGVSLAGDGQVWVGKDAIDVMP